MASQRSTQTGHEESDANAKGLMWFGVALVLTLVILQMGLSRLFFIMRDHQAENGHPASVESTLISQRKPPSEPRLQSNPEADLATYLGRESRLLSSYGWIDKSNGVARIPIERAMALSVGHSLTGTLPRAKASRESRGSRD